jgi:hypothetical protein
MALNDLMKGGSRPRAPALRTRKSPRERRAVIDGAFSPDATPVALYNPMHGGQPDARSGKPGLRMKTPEWHEELFAMRHIEPRAIVAHEVGKDARC